MESINNEIKEEMQKLIETVNPLDYFSSMIVPEWEGDKTIRQAILLMLASSDIGKKRGRIHILLVGKEGTGKSMITNWLTNNIGAEYIDANTTRAGLVGDARGKDLTEGALSKAHKGVLVIDEFEFLQDREALRLAMEQGWFKIKKGSIETRVNAEVKIVASANEINKISPPLKSRFDFIFEFTEPSPEESKKISQKILDNFFSNQNTNNIKLLKAYLNYIRSFEPAITEENLQRAKKIFQKYFEHKEQGQSGRWIESVTRIATAIAKCNYRDVIPDDFVKALALKDKDLMKWMSISNGE